MVICPGCGREAGDKSECPHCRYTPIISEAQETTKNKKIRNNLFDKQVKPGEKRLNTFLKVIIIIIIIILIQLITGLGPVFELIVGIFLMKKGSSESTRSFGKLLVQANLTIISLILLYFFGTILYWVPRF